MSADAAHRHQRHDRGPLDGDLDEDQRQDVNLLHHSAQSLLQIIGDILDFSKIEAGKLELAPETISIPDLVEGCVANFAQTASRKGLQIHNDTSQAIGPAHLADPLRLQQILNNLLSNAVKFTHKGHVTVRVRCLGSTKGAERLVFEVQDTGIGVSEANQSKLFQSFSQAETNTTRRFGGTGLGLAICAISRRSWGADHDAERRWKAPPWPSRRPSPPGMSGKS